MPASRAASPNARRVYSSFEVELEPQRTLEIARALAPGGRALFTARASDGRLVAMQWQVRILDAANEVVLGHFRTAQPGINTSYGGWTAHGEAEHTTNFPVGTYTLELRHPDFAPVDRAFTIGSDTVTRVDVALIANND